MFYLTKLSCNLLKMLEKLKKLNSKSNVECVENESDKLIISKQIKGKYSRLPIFI